MDHNKMGDKIKLKVLPIRRVPGVPRADRSPVPKPALQPVKMADAAQALPTVIEPPSFMVQASRYQTDHWERSVLFLDTEPRPANEASQLVAMQAQASVSISGTLDSYRKIRDSASEQLCCTLNGTD